jgi:hypothetical protein
MVEKLIAGYKPPLQNFFLSGNLSIKLLLKKTKPVNE